MGHKYQRGKESMEPLVHGRALLRDLDPCLDDKAERPAQIGGASRPNLLHSRLESGGSDLDRPKNKPRRGPYCGAPTPTPVPLRI